MIRAKKINVVSAELLIKIIVVAIILVGIIIGALYLNSAAYHLWLADGPPVDNPDAHLKAFYRHFVIAASSLTISIMVGVIFWIRRKK